MIFTKQNYIECDFSKKKLNFTPKTIVLVISIEWCCLKPINDIVHDLYSLISEIYCDRDSILLLILRLVSEK